MGFGLPPQIGSSHSQVLFGGKFGGINFILTFAAFIAIIILLGWFAIAYSVLVMAAVLFIAFGGIIIILNRGAAGMQMIAVMFCFIAGLILLILEAQGVELGTVDLSFIYNFFH